MESNFRIKALPITAFEHLFLMDEKELTALGAKRMIVNKKPGFPCRVGLKDVEIGEEVVLVPYQHHDVASPYRASGPIFVGKDSCQADLQINEIPQMLNHRFLSLRAYDYKGIMINALATEGNNLKSKINLLFEDSNISYIQVHNAGPGCFNCQIERATTL